MTPGIGALRPNESGLCDWFHLPTLVSFARAVGPASCSFRPDSQCTTLSRGKGFALATLAP